MDYFVNVNSIRRWAESIGARSMLPHLVRRLVWATIPRGNLTKNYFPAYESVQRSGVDGETECQQANEWVPNGHTVWELSVEKSPGKKANRDFANRSESSIQTSYVCLTARHWKGKKDWAAEKRAQMVWRNVEAYDCDDLQHWLESAPGVAIWFGQQIGERPEGVDDISTRWDAICGGTTTPLHPSVFLTSRGNSVSRIEDWVSSPPDLLTFQSRSPIEVLDFVCAAVTAMDDDARASFQARAVIVESLPAWRRLRDSIFPAILIVDPTLPLTAEEIGRAITRGHHVLIASEPHLRARREDQMLERPREFELREALEESGLRPVEAEQSARACGGSLAILKRRLARFPERRGFDVKGGASESTIAVCLLLGGWDGKNEADRTVVESITGIEYAHVEPELQKLASCRDPVLFQAAGHWRLVSKDDAWANLGVSVSASMIRDYESLVVEIMCDDDPRFELPESERWLARIHGHHTKYSGTIKAHVAQTLAFLGTFGERLDAARSVDIPGSVSRIVASILSPTSTWHRWASLGASLALLAEASPRRILRAIREDLDKAEPELVRLMGEEGVPLFSGCNHAGLLWSLETLAWSAEFLPEVCRSLLLLTADDPGGQWSNRPGASICEILSYWMPHTLAGLEMRINAVDLLIETRREAAWPVLLALLPETAGGVAMPTHRPMWQGWANEWSRGVPQAESLEFITAVSERVIREAGQDAERWKSVLERMARLSGKLHETLIRELSGLAGGDLSEADRRLVSDELSEQINRHRFYQDSHWSVPLELIDRLEAVLPKLKPQTPVLRHAWMFQQWPDRFFERYGTHEERDRALEEARDSAIVEIVANGGVADVTELAHQVDDAFFAGRALARTTEDSNLADLIPSHLSGDQSMRQLAAGFVAQRVYRGGENWVNTAIELCDTDDQRAWLLVLMPFEPQTWNRADVAGTDVRKLFWQRCRAFNPNLGGADVTDAVGLLIEFRRPGDAIDLLGMAIHGKKELAADTLLQALEALLELDCESFGSQLKRADSHEIQYLIETLQKRNDVDTDRMIRVEWNFLGLLQGHDGHAPETLKTHLANHPEFFVEVLTLCYRPRSDRDKPGSNDEQTGHREAMATQGYRLLREWDRIPGTQPDGTVDVADLRSWCQEARRLAKEADRLEVCDNHIGQVLAHAPTDPDSTWPCNTVCTVASEIESDSLVSGLHCGIFNLSGVRFRSRGGDDEREFAAKYRAHEERIRFKFPFVANVLADLVEDYERQARQMDEEERWGE